VWLFTTLKRVGFLNLLLVFIPVAGLLELLDSGPVWVFLASALAIVPLAAWMGHSTEHLASRVGEGIGGFLNATFGNAAELIIAIAALRQGQVEVVRSSLIGSILGNILLIFGLSMLVGGTSRKKQVFNRTAARAGVSLMVVSVVALVIPAVFHGGGLGFTGEDARVPKDTEQRVAIGIALVLLITYGLSLLFTLKTHKGSYTSAGEGEKPGKTSSHAVWSIRRSVLVLLGSTAIIAPMSELLVHQIDAAAQAMGISQIFVGIFLVAIIGNAAEHSTAVLMASKDRMDLAMGVAVGSSQQIALFVAPLLVLISHLFHEPMTFVFTPMEVISVALSTFIFHAVAGDGESNWLEGVLFLAVYAILGIGFFFLP
jgi:Ca2+:H+ antiporter